MQESDLFPEYVRGPYLSYMALGWVARRFELGEPLQSQMMISVLFQSTLTLAPQSKLLPSPVHKRGMDAHFVVCSEYMDKGQEVATVLRLG